MSLLWGGKKWRPASPVRKQPINQSIEELMKPLSEKTWKGNVWGSVIMNVPETSAVPPPSPSVTPTITPTSTVTPTPTVTPTLTPTPSPSAANIEFRTSFEDGANLTTYTFSSLSTGGAGVMAVSFGWEGAAGDVSSVTIGGISATLAYKDIQAGPGIATYYATTTASTVDVVITFTEGQLRIIGGMWRMTGLISSTPISTAIDVAPLSTPTSASTITLTGLTSGSVVIALQDNGSPSTPVSWTNATERFDLDAGDAGMRASGADASGTGTSLTIDTTYTTSTQRTKLLGVAWR